MSNKTACLCVAIGILLAGFSEWGTAAGAGETVVQPPDLPAPARKAIQTQAGSGKVGEITKAIQNGLATYEVTVTTGEKERTFTVDEQGELLSLQVTMEELPRPVQRTVRTQLGRGKLGDIFKEFADGEVSYDVELTKQRKTRHLTVAEDGELLEVEMFLDELPAAVREAVEKEQHGGQCDSIYRTAGEGEANYDVDITRNGKTRSLTFAGNGTVICQEEPVTLSEAPEAVQKTLRAKLGDSRLLSLTKAVQKSEVTYEADLLKAGKHESLGLKPDGQVLVPEAK